MSVFKSILKKSKYLLFYFGNILFPADCDFCGVQLSGMDFYRLCRRCVILVKNTNIDDVCDRCAHPIVKNRCPSCVDGAFFFENCAAVFLNKGIAQNFIYTYKFKKRSSYAHVMAKLMIKKYGNYISSFDFLVPIVLSSKSIVLREFCPVKEVVRQVSKELKVPMIRAIVKKNRATDTFHHFKSLNERRSEVSKQYTFKKKYGKMLFDKKVLLIDDIFTTGSTLNAVSRHIYLNTKPRSLVVIIFSRSVKDL